MTLTENPVARQWLPRKAGTDEANDGEIDFSTVKKIVISAGARFVRVQSHSGEALLVKMASGSDPGTPDAGALRVASGASEEFICPAGPTLYVNVVTAAGGAGAGSVLVCP